MRNIIIGICLVALLVFSSQAIAGQKAENRMKEIAKRKAGVRKVLGELRGRVSLDRSVHEFFDEMGLFDNRLYGRLHSKENCRDRVKELKTNIDYFNMQLTELRDSQDNGQSSPSTEGGTGMGISQLESQINSMRGELGALQARSLLEGGTELLDASNYDKDEQFGRSMDSFSDPVDRIEHCLKILESLEEEEKKLEEKKKAATPAK